MYAIIGNTTAFNNEKSILYEHVFFFFLSSNVKIFYFLNHNPDTLLNVFLAIAVDNLANAQELTAAEEDEEDAKAMV